jgi:periplasmic protein TonB
MRQVYTPPSTKVSWPLTIVGALVGTLCVFLVLPLTQVISSGAKRQLEITQIDTAAPPPPPPTMEAEPPPPPEPEEAEPPPQLNEESMPLSLSDLDLDVATGTGGAFGRALDFGGEEALQDVAIFDIADLDQRPQPIAQVAPRHPPELLKAKIEGSVVLLFVLDENGRVQDPRIESSSRPEFEKPALAAVKRWRFKPGTRDGQAVRSYIRQQIAFRLTR